MTLNKWEYGDPAKVAEKREEHSVQKSCSGCVYWSTLWGIAVCKKHEGRAGKDVSVCPDFQKKNYINR